MLINKRECTGLKYFNDSKAFVEYSNSMDDIYKNTEEYNSKKKRKILVVFDDIFADMLCDKKNCSNSNWTIYERKKTKYYSFFITQSYFALPKNIRLNSTHYFLMKIQNKRELQKTAFNHSSDVDFQGFINLYKNCTKPCSFLAIGTTLASDNSLRFRKNLLERIWKLIMAIDDKNKDEKLLHNINREVAKISPLLTDKADRHEYLTGEEILPPDQNRIIEQAKITFLLSVKHLEKK